MTPEARSIHERVLVDASRSLFDQKILSNLVRPTYVERMITFILGHDWRHVGSDWAGWDIEGPNGIRVEVKQSAARQTWSNRKSLEGRLTKGRFDIAVRTGYFTEGGMEWVPGKERPADIYIFAWHGVGNEEIADHRDVTQWRFFVISKSRLKDSRKSISLNTLRRMGSEVSHERLRDVVFAKIQEIEIQP